MVDSGRSQAIFTSLRAVWTDVRLCIRRALGARVSIEPATLRERTSLLARPHPITAALSQDAAAWRRSVLAVAAVLMVLHALLAALSFQTIEQALRPTLDALYDAERGVAESTRSIGFPDRDASTAIRFQEIVGRYNAFLIDAVGQVQVASSILSAVLVMLAAARWMDVSLSRRLALGGWAVFVGVPVLTACIPMTAMMSFELAPDPEAWRAAWGVVFALNSMLVLAPKTIAILPGIIRSCVAVKILLPDSIILGWVIALTAPLYLLFLLVLLGVLVQIQGSMLVFAGMLCYSFVPVVYLRQTANITKPQPSTEVWKRLRRVRRSSGAAAILGTLLLGLYIVQQPGWRLADVVVFISGLGGAITLMTVVGADTAIGLLCVGHDRLVKSDGAESAVRLGESYQLLTDAGFSFRRGPEWPP